MKYFQFLLLAILALQSCNRDSSQEPLHQTQIENIASYTRVWGLLKYYSPAASEGKPNWDSLFIRYYPQVKNSRSNEIFNRLILTFVREVKEANMKAESIPIRPDSNYDKSVAIADFSWTRNSIFHKEVAETLDKIIKEYKPRSNYYLTSAFEGGNIEHSLDNGFYSLDSLDESKRLLALARYWNIINYFFPYKDVIGVSWDTILYKYIPKMVESKDSLDYLLSVLHLCHEINDAHSFVRSARLEEYVGTGLAPIDLVFTEGQTVLIGASKYLFANPDSALDALGLKKGDVLLKINNKPISELRSKLRSYVPGSNDASINRNINYRLLRGKPDEVVTLTVSDGIAVRSVSTTYEPISKFQDVSDTADPWRILTENIGYIDMAKLQSYDVDAMMDKLGLTNAIIIDLRKGANSTLYYVGYYLTSQVPFAYTTVPNIQRPGYIYKDSQMNFVGNTGSYKGKIIILVNENTQSHLEFSAMSFQAVPNAITIGSQTAGADGNVSEVFMPGGVSAVFSGLGIFYPDGTPTQRVGVKIDHVVKPTVKGIREGRDEILDSAINFLYIK